MSRAISNFRSFSAATIVVVASLVLALPVGAQSDEEQRRYEEWKQQQKAQGEPTHAPSATGDTKEWVTDLLADLTNRLDLLCRKQEEYCAARTQKKNNAYAACINWEKSNRDFIFIRGYGAAWGQQFPHMAENRALSECNKRRGVSTGGDCECEVVDLNGQFVLRIPADLRRE